MKNLNTNRQDVLQVLTRGVTEVLPSVETLAGLMSQKRIRLYLGIDPTGAFLTLGHAVVLRKLQQFADLGHEVILLIGNGTVRIGDPTGRDTTRPVLTDEQIKENFKNWKLQASKILDFNLIEIKYNGDWLDKLNFADLVKLMAQTTVQQLTERDMFQKRIKEKLPIFGHEIIYPLLQGYDSVAMNVDLEIGGTDQTFNMLMGRHLQKAYNNHEKWVLTTPILNGLDGRKMSKSFNNFIAITDNPNDMYCKLMSLQDELMMEYFICLTEISQEEIDEIRQRMKEGENPMVFKKQLAFAITSIFHSADIAKSAEEFFKASVQEKVKPVDFPMRSITEESQELVNLIIQLKPKLSRNSAKILIRQGGVKIDEVVHNNPKELITPQNNNIVHIGKREYVQIKIIERKEV